MSAIDWIVFVLFLGSLLWAIDRQIEIKDVEKDLKLYLGDLLVARDLAESHTKVHYHANVSATKTLIRKHFKL